MLDVDQFMFNSVESQWPGIKMLSGDNLSYSIVKSEFGFFETKKYDLIRNAIKDFVRCWPSYV